MTKYWAYAEQHNELDLDSAGEHDTQEQAYQSAQDRVDGPEWIYLINYSEDDKGERKEISRIEAFIQGPSRSDLAEHGTWYKGCAI